MSAHITSIGLAGALLGNESNAIRLIINFYFCRFLVTARVSSTPVVWHICLSGHSPASTSTKNPIS